jgi:hypothetical protein
MRVKNKVISGVVQHKMLLGYLDDGDMFSRRRATVYSFVMLAGRTTMTKIGSRGI